MMTILWSMEEVSLIKQWKNNKTTYDNIRKIETDKGDDYASGCLLDYICLKV